MHHVFKAIATHHVIKNTYEVFRGLENRESTLVMTDKIAKVFPTYLMESVNHESFNPRNFCRLRYLMEFSLTN